MVGRSIDKGKGLKREFGITFKITFAFAIVILLLLTTSPITSFNQLIKSAEAGTLTNVNIIPTNNIVNTRSTYDIIFATATTGTIKTIEMDFPSTFDVRYTFGPNPKLIDRKDIGSGSLSNGGPSDSATKLVYTVDNPVSVPAGTKIRFDIGRIDNSQTPNIAFSVTITTKNTAGTTIDGPTSSNTFAIKAINGEDIDPNFMIRKTLRDNVAGHAHGWDPDGVTTDFTISDHDVQIDEEAGDETFVTLMLRGSHTTKSICMVNDIQFEEFFMNCNTAPANDAELHYEIHKLPPNVIASSLSSLGNEGTKSPSLP